jgi:two-component system sensor histidine kinase QseC
VGPSTVVKAEAGDIGQILDNLLDNALRYAPGPIEIAIERDPDAARLVVEDQGPGIADEDLDRVTERFYRGRGASSGGSGLGLAVVRELAERWGGGVSVGRGERGTRIEVRFPLAQDF